MNDTLRLVIAVLVGTGILSKGIALIRDAIIRSRIPTRPSDALRALFGKRKNFQFFHLATVTLKERGEDVSCALPAFLDLALSGTWVLELIGKGCLKTHSGDILPTDINLEEKRLSDTTKSRRWAIQKEMD